MVAVETANLRKEYDDTVAVRDLTMTVQSGTVYGFLGPNGAGKTTVLQMLTCLLRPTAGTATVCGIPISERDRVRSRIGFLPEDPPLYEELTPREQLQYWARFRGLDRSQSDRRIADLLERFDLLDDADRRIGAFSTGMRQKVGLAQALLHEPELLFLDEPTSGLDPNAVRTVKEVLREYVQADATVFLSTHILSVVDEVADEVGVLHDGELIAEGSPSQVKQEATSSADATLDTAFRELTMGQSV